MRGVAPLIVTLGCICIATYVFFDSGVSGLSFHSSLLVNWTGIEHVGEEEGRCR